MTKLYKKVAYTLLATVTLSSVTSVGSFQIIHADDSISTAVASSASSTNVATNDNTDTDSTQVANQSHTLQRTYVVIGSGVQDSDAVTQALGGESSDTQLTTNGAEVDQYANLSGITDAQVQSSVRIQSATPGTGTKVNIVNFNGNNNITAITAQQYALAANASGVKDAIITVTSPRAVDGSGALAGVYVALAQDGVALNPQNTNAANALMQSTSSAIADNTDDASYPGKLTSSVAQAAAKGAEQVQNNETPTPEENLDNALQSNGISDSTSQSARQPIIIALTQMQEAPISQTKTFITNMNNVSNFLADAKGNTMALANDIAGSGIWAKVTSFFQGLKLWFTQIFNRGVDISQSTANQIANDVKNQTNNSDNSNTTSDQNGTN